MPADAFSSNEVTVRAGGRASLIQACQQSVPIGHIPPSMGVSIGCAPVNPTAIQNSLNAYIRSVRAIIRWKGTRGGSEVEVDAHKGVCVSVPGCAIDIEVINNSDPAITVLPNIDPVNINDYRCAAVIGKGSAHSGEEVTLTERNAVIAGATHSDFIHVPRFARDVTVGATPILGPGAFNIEWWYSPVAAAPAALIVEDSTLFQRSLKPDGAEFIRATNPGAVARTFTFRFHIDI